MKKKYLKSWGIPILFSLGLFLCVRPTFAQLLPEEVGFSDYLIDNDLKVGTDNDNGYTRVFYEYGSQRKFISEEGVNAGDPVTKGRYIVYSGEVNGVGQVFRYDVITESVVQLSSSSTNLRPKVSANGWVVWEGWVPSDDTWQIFLFDGTGVTQLTAGDTSINPEIENEYIVYARQDVATEWKSVVYSKLEDKHVVLSYGDQNKDPKLVDGKILLRNKEFPLRVQDVYTLNFEAGRVDEDEVPTQSMEDVLGELNKDPFVLDDVATESAAIVDSTPEPTSTPDPTLPPASPTP